MCSGEHTALLLLSKLRGWELETYWEAGHPALTALAGAIARVLGTTSAKLDLAPDGCGLPSVVVALHEIARAYAFLAEPRHVQAPDPRTSVAPALAVVRDAMLANPEMIAGTRDRLDTSLMKAVPGRLISKTGAEGLRAVALLGSTHDDGQAARPSGLAIKIEDGGAHPRAGWAAAVEALLQVGRIDGASLRALARFHQPATRDPHGRSLSTATASFELVPVGELIQ
jgi:L-asparaginase II